MSGAAEADFDLGMRVNIDGTRALFEACRALAKPPTVVFTSSVAVFGGAPIRSQQSQLRAGGHVVVGTVGRVLDLLGRGSLVLSDCRFVVLDEADEMLDLGFLEDVERMTSTA